MSSSRILQGDCRVCLVHYHEIGLKGRNRSQFERRLISNLNSLLRNQPVTIRKISGRILITLDEEGVDFGLIEQALSRVPGIVRVSCGRRVDRDLDTICKTALEELQAYEPFHSFKVEARRSNTDFPLPSPEINQLVGSYLCEHLPEKKVQMKDMDALVRIEIIQGSAYVYARSITAIGGLPVGSAGKVVCLLSSGIDSPVALSRIVKRGAVAVGVHFSGRPQTADTSEYLVDQIAQTLAPMQGIGRIYVVPLGDYQRAMAEMVTPSLRIIFYRRLMYLVAQRIAEMEGAKALVTGESLGQVASQTLDNIAAVDQVVTMPVLRPLIGTDKQDIIAEAKFLGTYDISIQPADDCCTLFMPRSPETHADLEQVVAEWENLPIEQWVEEIMASLEHKDYPCPSYHPSHG